jgi:hypothetical protein
LIELECAVFAQTMLDPAPGRPDDTTDNAGHQYT